MPTLSKKINLSIIYYLIILLIYGAQIFFETLPETLKVDFRMDLDFPIKST